MPGLKKALPLAIVHLYPSLSNELDCRVSCYVPEFALIYDVR